MRIELILESNLAEADTVKLRSSLVKLMKETEYYKRLVISKDREIKKLNSEIAKKNIQIQSL